MLINGLCHVLNYWLIRSHMHNSYLVRLLDQWGQIPVSVSQLVMFMSCIKVWRWIVRVMQWEFSLFLILFFSNPFTFSLFNLNSSKKHGCPLSQSLTIFLSLNSSYQSFIYIFFLLYSSSLCLSSVIIYGRMLSETLWVRRWLSQSWKSSANSYHSRLWKHFKIKFIYELLLLLVKAATCLIYLWCCCLLPNDDNYLLLLLLEAAA